MSYILTYTGKKFDHYNFTKDDICIEDIAHALSLVCRFGGHCNEFYSVAQHSVLVSSFVKPEFALWGLLHDASEAYTGDMCSPLKRQPSMHEFKQLEKDIMWTVYLKYGLGVWPEPPEVKTIDLRLLATEARDMFNTTEGFGTEKPLDYYHIIPWSPRLAEERFLARFKELYEQKGKKQSVSISVY